MKTFRIKITHNEFTKLIELTMNKSLTVDFGPSNVWITERTEGWAIIELAKMRGIVTDTVVR